MFAAISVQKSVASNSTPKSPPKSPTSSRKTHKSIAAHRSKSQLTSLKSGTSRPRTNSIASLEAPTVCRHPSHLNANGGYIGVRRNRCLIYPGRSKFQRPWDFFVSFVLLFVVFATPYEVAFLDNGETILFTVGVLCDFVFFVDMILTFFTPIRLGTSEHSMLITNHRIIARRYLKGWFFVDLMCVLPYGLLSELLVSLLQSPTVRAVRLLRLLKLMRVTKARRLFHKYRSSIGVPFRHLTLSLLFFSVVIAAHWLSCLLGVLAFDDGRVCIADEMGSEDCERTWATDGLKQIVDDGEVTHWDAYAVSLYTAMTMLVHPHANPPTSRLEVAIFVHFIFLSGFVWTRVISKSTAMFSSMDRHKIHYHQMMDDLKTGSYSKMLPRPLQQELRKYFLNLQELPEERTWLELQAHMSPMLRRETLRFMNRHWVNKVKYLSRCSGPLVAEISTMLCSSTHATQETLGEIFHMYILTKGMVQRYRDPLRDGAPVFKVMNTGAVWGDEHMLLTNPALLQPTAVMTLTFVALLSLDRDTFDEVVNIFPDDHAYLHKTYLRYSFIYGFLWLAQQSKQRQEQEEGVDEDRLKLDKIHTAKTNGSKSGGEARRHQEINVQTDGTAFVSSRSVTSGAGTQSHVYWTSVKEKFKNEVSVNRAPREVNEDHALVLQKLCNAYALARPRLRASWQSQLEPPCHEAGSGGGGSIPGTPLRSPAAASQFRRLPSDGRLRPLSPDPLDPDGFFRMASGPRSTPRMMSSLSMRQDSHLTLDELRVDVAQSIAGVHQRIDRLGLEVKQTKNDLISEMRLLREAIQSHGMRHFDGHAIGDCNSVVSQDTQAEV